MFEFDQYEPALRNGSEGERIAPYRPLADISHLSFLWWSEHCIECAEPACYATCALYQQRPDGRCRRFAYGIRRARRFASLRGYGADITFKRWGKLEAHGNALMEPAQAVLRRERHLALGAPVWMALSWLGMRSTRDPRGRPLPPVPRRIAKRLHAGGPSPVRPDHFLVEVYNPGPAPVRLQVSLRAAPDPPPADPASLVPPVLATLTLDPGYGRHRIAASRFARILESGLPFKITVMPEADDAVRLVFLSLDFVVENGTGEAAAPPVKCVVFDLDGTLWDGTLVEGGDARPREPMVRLVRALDARGILLSIASKNDHAAAWRRITEAGLGEYFLHPQIGWEPKSRGVRRIAERLGIGLDSFALIDDSPFERDEVARALPMVACFDPGEAEGLAADPRFRGSDTADAGSRRSYYRNDLARQADGDDWGEDYVGFLKSCSIVLSVARYCETDFERVLELVQRTNQLNFSGRKYTPDEIERLLELGGRVVYVLRCRDRYGSYGTVGAAFVRRCAEEIRVEDLMISCRVQGRGIEQGFLSFLAGERESAGARRLRVRYGATDRNRPARRALEALGFGPDVAGDGFCLDLTARPLPRGVVRVEADGCAPGLVSAEL